MIALIGKASLAAYTLIYFIEYSIVVFKLDSWSLRSKVLLPTLVILLIISFIYVYVFTSLFINVKNDAFNDHKILIKLDHQITYIGLNQSHANEKQLNKLAKLAEKYQKHVLHTDGEDDEEYQVAKNILGYVTEYIVQYNLYLSNKLNSDKIFNLHILSLEVKVLAEVEKALDIVQAEADEDLEVLLYYEILSSIIFFSLIMIMVMRGINKILVPLVELRKKIEEFSPDVNFSKNQPMNGDEIKMLLHAFKEMGDDIKYKEVQLTSALIEAEETNKSKSAFLANISHELRTPMLGILGFAELGMTKIDKVEKEKLFKYFVRIFESGTRLLKLLNNLLDLSKLEAGKMQFDFYEQSILVVLNDTLIELDSLISKNKLKIELDNQLLDFSLNIDKQRIHQVFYNVLSNAIKFSPELSTIKITLVETELTNDDKAIKIIVSDQGVGIPKEELEHVFCMFSQSSLTNTGAGGTGLGLSICRDILDKHQGFIYAENNKEQGVSFIIVLPKVIK
ncbi:sensor histidine kinase [Pseudoalteromonas denitrificans]|uniref:histidine kinase n=1 Tax=Pseudoalteromonas denitrificans DSM 6059 TaxID=1123010 RepID=A0A1I1H5P8_9GAMM|nr:HAMP domain-containing sensor histidine kinase [Pseudoalteromonas denitrificans]SFC16490.1 His Kinase A (phospho-acceptor) domain-containing protein [Pseudoalteromonas denitrificans DSM 6059]